MDRYVMDTRGSMSGRIDRTNGKLFNMERWRSARKLSVYQISREGGRIMENYKGNRTQRVWKPFNWIVLGFLLGIILPFVVDMVLFQTPFPCKTVESSSSGTLQICGGK